MKHFLKYKITSLSVLSLLCFAACEEILEKPLTKVEMVLIAPADNTVSREYVQTFSWEPVDGALKYQIQIVSNTFEFPTLMLVDSSVTNNNFIYSLKPGTYQWRVRALNGSSKSPYVIRNLAIDTASMKDQQVRLTAPANGLLTNSGLVTFKWQVLFGAKNYRLQVDTAGFTGSNLVLDQLVATNEYNFNLTKDAIYQWRVRAENDTAVSQYSLTQTITIDRTPPAAPLLTSPANDSTGLVLPVALQWSAVSDAVKYKLYVYKSDGTTLYDNTFPLTVTGTRYELNKGSSREKLYWQVKTLDQAGNESGFSIKRNFTLVN